MTEFDRAFLRILVILATAWAGWFSIVTREHQRAIESKMESIKAGILRLPDANRAPARSGK